VFAKKHELSTSTQVNFMEDRQKIRRVDSDAVSLQIQRSYTMNNEEADRAVCRWFLNM